MRIQDDIELHGLAIYLPKRRALVISDVHIGYEEALNKQGVLVPRIYFQRLYEKTKRLIGSLDVDTVIINGDLKHEFGGISTTEWRQTLQFLDLFLGRSIIITKGNHDTILGPIARKRNLETRDYFLEDGILICHGDRIFDLECVEKEQQAIIKTVIIGHEHPAVTLRTENRAETYKCFLIGTYGSGRKRRQLIAMPSYNEITEGTDILKDKILSPYLRQDLKKFRVIVYGKELYDFGVVDNLGEKRRWFG